MKAERKHELKHNDLDDFLNKVVRFLRENGAMLGILVAVVVLAVLTYNLLVSNRSASSPAGAWNDYFYALSENDPERALEKFIDDENDSSPAVLRAKLSLADLKLAKAAQQLFEDRTAAAETLAEAEKNYQDVEKTARAADVRDRARIGLGEVNESRNQVEEALKYYEMVLKSSPDSAQGQVAARAQKRLSSTANREFLTWFEKQQPAKKSLGGSGSPFGPSGALPETPNFELPGLPSTGEDPLAPGLDFPASKLPDSEAPVSDAPESETPESPTPPDAPVPPASDAEPRNDPPAVEAPPGEEQGTTEEPKAEEPTADDTEPEPATPAPTEPTPENTPE